ncbi:circadian clock protein KaiA [Gloeothece verrucosa]|uniref:Circadian clock oscillator protein KaiA n=1 Tax=Gloeothece verrucosa (strain PCC 7822) TaxID=497965 RepID=E0U7L2_GLOV7|nr:circadian clock protein KaiA [Gloeothece verrucosa]ADN13708.1 KaiA family protein [Gloeothece verrucosa PCC 7822]
MHFRLTIYLFVPETSIAQSLTRLLSTERYTLIFVNSMDELLEAIEENKDKIDCLVVLKLPTLLPLFNQLYEEGVLLPVVLLESPSTSLSELYNATPPAIAESRLPEESPSSPKDAPTFLYHSAEIRFKINELEDIASVIDQAITRFLHLGPNCSISEQSLSRSKPNLIEEKQNFLLLQQRRLAEKLKERLGYLGVYYKRNSEHFYRNLSSSDKKELLALLSSDYREVIINYFSQDFPVNQAIDQFVNRCFFADISVSQILEIHMELMDEFSQQLKLEGRSEEILLDYRLALIDILAHLGEMYRRSIPREDIPYELLFRID